MKRLGKYHWLLLAILSGSISLVGCGKESDIPIEKDNQGKMNTDITMDTEWKDGDEVSNDQTEGNQDQFYYNFITEATLNTQVHSQEMAITGNILYVPSGSWTPPVAGRKLVVEYWNLDTKKKLGTLPMPDDLAGSFMYRIYSMFCMGDLLFIGHGEVGIFSTARVDVYDISDTSNPNYLTCIGGYPNYAGEESAQETISVPYAIWGKDGKFLLLDNYRLSVYDVKSLTLENAGKIAPVKYMSLKANASDEPQDRAGFLSNMPDGSLYLTDPDRVNPAGLRKINWDNVMSATMGKVDDLIDKSGTLLSGVAMKKAMYFDENILVAGADVSNAKYWTTYYKLGQSEGVDCSPFFKPALQVTNLLPLDEQPDGKFRMVVSLVSKKVAIVRVDKFFLSDF